MSKNVNGASSEVDDQSGLAILATLTNLSRRLLTDCFPDDRTLFSIRIFFEDGKIWYAQAYDLGWVHALTAAIRWLFSDTSEAGG